ncbi:MAG: monovalent cation/H+ antiporter complex subunit F [Pseudohongiellaceae bacterium]
MTEFYLAMAGILFLNVVAGLWRVLRGPDPADSLVAAQLFGTTAAAILLLLAEAGNRPELRDVSLVFAALTVVAVVAFVRLSNLRDGAEDDEPPQTHN